MWFLCINPIRSQIIIEGRGGGGGGEYDVGSFEHVLRIMILCSLIL